MKTKSRLNWIDTLPEKIRDIVRSDMTEISLDKGEIVLAKGQPVNAIYEVRSGRVSSTYEDAGGCDFMIAMYLPQTSFGELDICSESSSNFYMTCIEKSRLGVLSSKRFNQLRAQYPEINHSLLKQKTINLKWLLENLANTVIMDVEARLSIRLYSLAQAIGQKEQLDDKVFLVIPLTQENLAKMTGINRGTINRILSEFEKRQIVKSEYGRLIILDKDALLDIVVTANLEK